MALTDKQEAFCREYLKDSNATQAAIRAGYSKATAYSQGQRLLKNVEVAAKVRGQQQEQQERTNITADWVLQKLVENAERAMQARAVLDAEGEETGEYRYDGNVANRALELIGKSLGMFSDNKKPTAGDGAAVHIYTPDNGR